MPKLVLLLEPDRIMADCIRQEFAKQNIKTHIVSSPDEAVKDADKQQPDLIIAELSLPAHSGTEFLYEFRTYSDWSNIPFIVHSSIKVSGTITKSKDWKLLNINKCLYKPVTSLQKLVIESINLLEDSP